MRSVQTTDADSVRSSRTFWGRGKERTRLSLRAFRRSWQAYALLSPIFILLIIFVY